MTTPAPLSRRVVESLVDDFIAADARLSREAEGDFRNVPAEWRDGTASAAWRTVDRIERRRRVRSVIARRVAPPVERAESAKRLVPRPVPRSRGYVVACADGCGEFVPARGPRPTLRYVAGHSRPRG